MTIEIEVVSHYSADNIGLWHVHWFFVVDGISMPKACRADTLPRPWSQRWAYLYMWINPHIHG